MYRAEEKAGLRTKLGLPNDGSRLVLAFAKSFYKNEQTSLAVALKLQKACSQRVLLVRLGPVTTAWRENVRNAGMLGRVIEIAEVNWMWELYNAVDCLLFPSWYEGFGLPPIEAMACGIPVVTSNVAALSQVIGEAGLMAPPNDVGTLAEAVRLMLEDRTRRDEQIAKGLSHARKFSWERTARETVRVYERLLAREE
ncbi:MAG: glycosyltransferase [Acidobacteria bacterium]|nr:glycosyltransferase [Acidobacteriota bacterium]